MILVDGRYHRKNEIICEKQNIRIEEGGMLFENHKGQCEIVLTTWHRFAVVIGWVYGQFSKFHEHQDLDEALHYGSFVESTAADTINETCEAMQTSVFCAILNDSLGAIDEAMTDARNGMEKIEEQVALIK